MVWRFLERRKKILLLALVPLLGLVFITTSWRAPALPAILERSVMFLTAPVLEMTQVSLSALRGAGNFLISWGRLHRENKELMAEVARLRQEVQQVREKESSLQRLEKMLEYREQTGFRMTAASVIGHDSTNLFRTILINKGSRDGLHRNQAVVTPEGVVGRVVKVFHGTARVLLLVDRSSGIDALVQRTRDQGVVTGLNPESCEMKYLSRQAEVSVGDYVVTSGMGGIFPKGIRIGKINRVDKGGYLFQKVLIEPTAPLERLEEVMIVLGRGEQDE